jgi:hypothetical protein
LLGDRTDKYVLADVLSVRTQNDKISTRLMRCADNCISYSANTHQDGRPGSSDRLEIRRDMTECNRHLSGNLVEVRGGTIVGDDGQEIEF